MSTSQKIRYSILINIGLYLLAGFLPCDPGGFISLCSRGSYNMLFLFVVFVIQFGILFNFTDLGYYTTIGLDSFPNFSLFVLVWAIILIPFYIEPLRKRFRELAGLSEEKNAYNPNYKHIKNYCLVGQKAIVLNAERKILMLKRSEKTGMAKWWSLAGGALDKNEEPIASIRREILEETGLTVGDITPYHIKSRLHNNDQIIVIGYVCKAQSEDVRLNWEHTEYCWCNKEEALALPCTPDGKEFVEMYNTSKII